MMATHMWCLLPPQPSRLSLTLLSTWLSSTLPGACCLPSIAHGNQKGLHWAYGITPIVDYAWCTLHPDRSYCVRSTLRVPLTDMHPAHAARVPLPPPPRFPKLLCQHSTALASDMRHHHCIAVVTAAAVLCQPVKRHCLWWSWQTEHVSTILHQVHAFMCTPFHREL